MPDDKVGGGLSRKGWLASDELVKERACAEDVSAGVHLLPTRTLRREIAHLAERDPRADLPDRARHPEIAQLHLSEPGRKTLEGDTSQCTTPPERWPQSVSPVWTTWRAPATSWTM